MIDVFEFVANKIEYHSAAQEILAKYECEPAKSKQDLRHKLAYIADKFGAPALNEIENIHPDIKRIIYQKTAFETFHELAGKGFLAEIVTDAWANWAFKDGKPDHSTATPATPDDNHVCWRGCFWYFDKATNKLCQDDVGCFSVKNGGAERAAQELIKTYEAMKEYINPNGFNL